MRHATTYANAITAAIPHRRPTVVTAALALENVEEAASVTEFRPIARFVYATRDDVETVCGARLEGQQRTECGAATRWCLSWPPQRAPTAGMAR
jgi:hypothetical protein